MPKDVFFDIINGYKKEEFVEFDPRQITNMFVVNDQMSRSGKAAYPTPGLNLSDGIDFSDITTGGGRAAFVYNKKGYAVVKNKVFQISVTTAGIVGSLLGSITTQSGHVGIAGLGDQVIFVDGVRGWVFNEKTRNFLEVTSAGFPKQPIDVSVLANRAIVQWGEKKLWNYSDAGDASSWPALNFNSIQSYPDINVANATLNGRYFNMGEISVESWYDAGAQIDPYRRDHPAYEFGCAARSSVASAFGVLVWLSRTTQGVGSVVATTGGQPTPISDQALDTQFEKYINPDDASAYIYKNELGHIMYVINFTEDNASWMYDFNTKEWSDLDYKAKDRHLGQKHLYLGGKHYVLDYESPYLYALSSNYYDDDGVKIRRRIVSPIFLDNKTYRKITINRITIDLKHGTGTDCDIEPNPYIYLRTSMNGGVSFANQQKGEIGKIGERIWSTSFYRAGLSKTFVFEIEHYNAVPFVVMGAALNVDIAEFGE